MQLVLLCHSSTTALFWLLVHLIIAATTICAWNLSNLGLSQTDYVIVDVSVFYVRAFICIQRATATRKWLIVGSNKTVQQMIIPSLIEVPWPEPQHHLQQSVAATPRLYPSDLDHALRNDRECNGIIAARATAVDMSTGDLWVLDGGSAFCAPKLIEYDLIGGNEETHRYLLGDYARRHRHRRYALASVHVGPDTTALATSATAAASSGSSVTAAAAQSRNSRRLFMTVFDADFVLVYGPAERRLWKLKLITANDQIVVPRSIAFRPDGQLYIGDRTDRLWLTAKLQPHFPLDDPKRKRNGKRRRSFQVHLKVRFVADLLGRAGRLSVDPAGLLYYALARDGAVMRWDTRKPLQAEHHDVLLFSAVPVVRIVFGYKGGVWMVGQKAEPILEDGSQDEHCRRLLAHFTGSPAHVERMDKRSMGAAVLRQVRRL